jgi:hypothetical protein
MKHPARAGMNLAHALPRSVVPKTRGISGSPGIGTCVLGLFVYRFKSPAPPSGVLVLVFRQACFRKVAELKHARTWLYVT